MQDTLEDFFFFPDLRKSICMYHCLLLILQGKSLTVVSLCLLDLKIAKLNTLSSWLVDRPIVCGSIVLRLETV